MLEHETFTGSQIKVVLAQVSSQQTRQQRPQIVATQSNSQSNAGPPSTPNAAACAAPKAAATATKAKGIAPVGS